MSYQNQNEGHELNWNSAIENDSPSFTLLPEGDYDFVVTNLERTRHSGSAKLPPCDKAIVHIRIEDEGGMNIIKHNLFLHSRCEGLLCDFFVGIGQRKKGERKNMDWSKVIGARGRAKIGIRNWVDNNGNDRQVNEIKHFYSPEEQPQQAKSDLPWAEAQPPYNDEVF